MNSINQNHYNNYDLNHHSVGFKSGSTPVEHVVQMPDMYYIPDPSKKPKTFREIIKQWDIMNLVSQWLETPLLMAGTCLGLSLGIDAFDRSCNKPYEKSIIGKAAKLGDKIEKSGAIQNQSVQKGLKGLKSGWNRVYNTAMKSDIVNSFMKTPSRPENHMALDELKHTNYRIVTQFKELARDVDLVDASTEVRSDGSLFGGKSKGSSKGLSWKDWDLSKDELKYLKEKMGNDNLSKVSQEELGNRIKLKRIGKTEEEISSILSGSSASERVRDELLKKGGKDRAWLEKVIMDETGETAAEVKEFSKNLKDIRINKSKVKIPYISKLFSDVKGFESIYNRLHSMSDGAETSTGRFMSKLVQKFHRGITFGGGKFMVLLFVGPMITQAFLNTKKADNKEKVSTLVCGVTEPATWVFTFPLVLRFMHGYGGIQYAGMGEEKVKEYRKLIEEFNTKVDMQEFNDSKSYNAAKKELKGKLKALRKVENESFFTTIMRKLSHFSKCDLEKIKPYKNNNAIGNLIRKIPNTFKNITFGYVGRVLLFMMAFLPFVDKIIKKGLNGVFGRSYDEYKEEEFAEKKKEQENYSINDLRTRLEDRQEEILYPNAAPTAKASAYANPLDEMIRNRQAQNNTNNVNRIENSQPATDAEGAETTPQTGTAVKTDETQDGTQIVPPIKESISQNITDSALLPTETKKDFEQKTESTNELTPQSSEELKENQNPKIINNPKPQEGKNIINPAIASIAPKLDNYTYIPSQNSVFNNSPLAQPEKYIPAQTAANFSKTFDNSKLDQVLRHASRAEQRAINILGGNFENA